MKITCKKDFEATTKDKTIFRWFLKGEKYSMHYDSNYKGNKICILWHPDPYNRKFVVDVDKIKEHFILLG